MLLEQMLSENCLSKSVVQEYMYVVLPCCEYKLNTSVINYTLYKHVHIFNALYNRDLISPSCCSRPHILTDESVDAETMIVLALPSLHTVMVMAATEFTASW